MEPTQFDNNLKAIAALLTTIVTGVSGFVGLPAYVTPDLIALTVSAITACASVFYYLRGRAAAPTA